MYKIVCAYDNYIYGEGLEFGEVLDQAWKLVKQGMLGLDVIWQDKDDDLDTPGLTVFDDTTKIN